jgi:hypothetical protein
MTAGAQGASVFNNAITIGSKYLTSFISDIPIVGGVLKSLGEGAASYVTQVNNQSDALFRSFQDLSKVGGSSKEGMQGVFDGMQQLGYTMQDLEKYKSVISENSALMSSLGGTVSQGIKEFGKISAGLQQTGLQTEFLRMGMTVEDINKGTATYLKIQQQTGQLQGKTTQQLTDGTAEYLRKQSELSRLTGLSVDQLAKKFEEDQKNERYQATMTELKMKAAAGDKDSANKLAYYTELVQKAGTMPEEVREGIRDTISGFGQQTEAGQKFARMSAGAADQIAKGAGTVDSALGTLGSDAKRQREATAGFVKAVGDQTTYYKQSTLLGVEAFNQSGKSATANSEAAKEEAAALRDGKNVDINNQVLMRQAQTATTTGLQSLVQLGVHPVTAAMVKFATTTENIVTAIPGVGDKTKELKNLRTTNPQTNQPIPGQTGFGGYTIDPQIVKNNEATLKGIQTNMAGFEQVLRQYNDILDPGKLLDKIRLGTPPPAATPAARPSSTAEIIRNAQGNAAPTSNVANFNTNQIAALMEQVTATQKSNQPTFDTDQMAEVIAKGNADLKSNTSTLNAKQITDLIAQKNAAPKSNISTLSAEQVAARTSNAFKDQSEAILAQMKAPVELSRQTTPTGPRDQSPTRLEENRPDTDIREERTAPQNTNVLATSLNQGFSELATSISQQTRSMDDLVDLMRKSIGVQGRILQQART